MHAMHASETVYKSVQFKVGVILSVCKMQIKFKMLMCHYVLQENIQKRNSRMIFYSDEDVNSSAWLISKGANTKANMLGEYKNNSIKFIN